MSMSNKYDKKRRDDIINDEQQITDLLEEIKTKTLAIHHKLFNQARANERVATGNNKRPGLRSANIYDEASESPLAPQQILNNLVLAWAALMTKDRQSVYAAPVTKDLNNAAAAELFTKLIEYTESEEGIAYKWHTSAIYAAYHGTGLMYIYFDPAKKRCVWRPLSIFDVYIDDKEESSDRTYVCTREFIDEYTAEEMISAAKPNADITPESEDYEDGQGNTHSGIPMYTIWYKPCPRYKTGLFATVVGNVVVEATEYPYTFPDKDGTGEISLLPVVDWTCRRLRGNSLGQTWANDCTPSQLALDELNSKLLRNAQTAQSYLVIPKSLQNNEGFDRVSQQIATDPTTNDSRIGWINPAPLDQNQINQKQSLIQSMYDSAGISAQTTGQSSNQSGRALAYQAELDVQKHADAFKSFEIAIRKSWNLDLKIKQKFYTDVQKTLLSDGVTELIWTGTDIEGIDVRLEARSERESASSTKLDKQKELVGQGFAGPETLNALSPDNVTQISRTLAKDLIDKYLNGEDVQITPETIEPMAFTTVLDEEIKKSLLQRDLQTVQLLQTFKQQFMKEMALANSPSQEPGSIPTDQQAPAQPLPESIDDETGLSQ